METGGGVSFAAALVALDNERLLGLGSKLRCHERDALCVPSKRKPPG